MEKTDEQVKIPFIYGVETEEEVGRILDRNTGHDVLFRGNLVFAFIKGPVHLIIVKYPSCDFYGLSMVTSGYTAIIPTIPKQYMEEFSTGCLSDLCGDKKLINILKIIINS